jgi:hypothetical protein
MNKLFTLNKTYLQTALDRLTIRSIFAVSVMVALFL